ncbi:MAG: discoidin domain-containing protein [Elusimicrobiota bacterium]
MRGESAISTALRGTGLKAVVCILFFSSLINSFSILRADDDEVVTMAASSGFQSAGLAIDGKMSSRWEARDEADNVWIMFGFRHPRKIKDLIIFWDKGSAKIYDIEISSNGSVWTRAAEIKNGMSVESKYIVLTGAKDVKKIRINCTKKVSKRNYSIREIIFNPKAIDGLLPGVVNRKVKCKDAPDQSYALYLPSCYDPAKKSWPVVYGFSPDAMGEDPVKLLKDSAEKHGFIIIGSNNAKNGPWEDVKRAIRAVVKDSKKRFNINETGCYTCGFSGGARMSFLMSAMYRSMIAGVIPCCAGFDDKDYTPEPNMRIYGLSGKKDFNNGEMQKALHSLGWPNNDKIQFVQFNGGHEWPSKKSLESAMDWMFAK